MKKTILFLQLLLFGHFLSAQVTPVQPKTATSVAVKTIPADQATLIRMDTKKVRSELEKLSDSLAAIQRDLNVLIESTKSNSDSKDIMQPAESKVINEVMDAMQAIQTRIEQMAIMSKYVNELRKSLQSKWPASKF